MGREWGRGDNDEQKERLLVSGAFALLDFSAAENTWAIGVNS